LPTRFSFLRSSPALRQLREAAENEKRLASRTYWATKTARATPIIRKLSKALSGESRCILSLYGVSVVTQLVPPFGPQSVSLPSIGSTPREIKPPTMSVEGLVQYRNGSLKQASLRGATTTGGSAKN
jgi:hypothetical protein